MELVIETFLRKSPRPQLSAEFFENGKMSEYRTAKNILPDVYEIGSIGKVFTTTLLVLLEQQGLLSSDDPVSKFRPDLPLLGNVSLKQLASHTSGLPRDAISGRFVLVTQSYLEKFIVNFRESDLTTYLRTLTKLRPPGSFSYSNVGMALLGSILASVLGTDYESAVLENICKPLGMHDTSVSLEKTRQERLVVGHDARGRPLAPFMWDGMEAAGVWRSTTGDMMLFLKAMLGHSGDVWSEVARVATVPVAKEASRMDVGLGWFIYQSQQAGSLIWHSGGTLGQNAAIAWSRERDCAIVLCSNQVPSVWKQVFYSRHSIDSVALKLVGGSS
jgi:D-alanyl-D-alanine-carboxypeptidase/D-alanyl-D-alanine-endopeptidase